MNGSRFRITRLVSTAVGLCLVASACGSGDEAFDIDPTQSDEASTNEAEELVDDDEVDVDPDDELLTTGTQVLVSAYGTTAGGPVDGFERWDGGCTVDAGYDGPQLSTGDISVPSNWVPIGSGDGITVEIGDIEKNLSAFLSQQNAEIGAEAVLENMFGTIDYEIVGTVQVGSSSFDVGFGGGAYRMTSLAGEIRGNGTLDLYHELNFGLTGSGDIAVVPLDEVLAVFESFTIDPCAVDEETLGFAERTFEIVD